MKVKGKVAIVTGGGGGIGAVLEPAEVARDVLAAIDEEHFLILPHANVLDMFRQKASDYERWLRGMRRYQASLLNDSQ